MKIERREEIAEKHGFFSGLCKSKVFTSMLESVTV